MMRYRSNGKMNCERCKEEIEEPSEIEEIWNMHEECIKDFLEEVDIKTQILDRRWQGGEKKGEKE